MIANTKSLLGVAARCHVNPRPADSRFQCRSQGEIKLVVKCFLGYFSHKVAGIHSRRLSFFESLQEEDMQWPFVRISALVPVPVPVLLKADWRWRQPHAHGHPSILHYPSHRLQNQGKCFVFEWWFLRVWNIQVPSFAAQYGIKTWQRCITPYQPTFSNIRVVQYISHDNYLWCVWVGDSVATLLFASPMNKQCFSDVNRTYSGRLGISRTFVPGCIVVDLTATIFLLGSGCKVMNPGNIFWSI